MVNAVNAQDWQSRSNLTSSEFQTVFNDLLSQGYDLMNRNIYNTSSGWRYSGIFEKIDNVSWQTRSGLTVASYETNHSTFTTQGYVLTYITGYQTSSGTRYAGIWRKQSNTDVISDYGMTNDEYQLFFDESVANGYVLNHVDGYITSDGTKYAAIFQKRATNGWQSWSDMTISTLEAKFNELTPLGYVVTHIDSYDSSAGMRYICVWEKMEVEAFEVMYDLTATENQIIFEDLLSKGYNLKSRSITNGEDGLKFATLWVK